MKNASRLIDETLKISPSEVVESTCSRKLYERLHVSRDFYEVDSVDLLDFAEAYAGLGKAVQEQLHTLMETGGDPEGFDINPNAVRLMADRLLGFNEEIDEAIKSYDESTGY